MKLLLLQFEKSCDGGRNGWMFLDLSFFFLLHDEIVVVAVMVLVNLCDGVAVDECFVCAGHNGCDGDGKDWCLVRW
jgi:hypothetical protein